jgi:hypothetical protein
MAEGQSLEQASAAPSVSPAGKGTGTTAAVGLSSFIVFAANRIESQLVREVLTLAAPTIGVAVTYLASIGSKQLRYLRGNWQLEKWIAEHVAERPKANNARKAIIDSELAEYRLRLMQRRLDNLS